MANHAPTLITVIVLSWIVFILTLVINALSANGGVDIGLFLNNTGAISDAYPTEVTPAAWTFSLWGIIYFFQVSWMLYLLSTLCRQNAFGDYLYKDPGVLTWHVHVLYMLANICNITWLFLWDRQLLGACLPIIALIPFSLYLATIAATKSLVSKVKTMTAQGLKVDIWLIRIFVFNGLAIYAAWTSIATLINLASVLIYRSPINASIADASTGALGVLLFEVCLWSFLDMVVFDKYTRFIFTPYFVVIYALAGIISKNNIPGSRNTVFTIVLLSLGCVVFVVKIILTIYRQTRRPVDELRAINLKDDYNKA